VHAVFTLPRELAPFALQNKQLIYGLLFHASAATLLEVARDTRHLGAEIGFFSVLHTWTSGCNIIRMCTASSPLEDWPTDQFPHFLRVSLGLDDEVRVCMADEYLLEEIRWEQTVGVHCFT